MTQLVRAPGKAMLIGEYAVLDGAPAAVAAVDRYASAVLQQAEPASAFISAAITAAREALAALPTVDPRELELPKGTPVVDTADFSLAGKKLGVGSSAAATVAAVGALFAAAGLDPASFRQEIRRAAAAAHEVAQGERGSGADILAATLGRVQALGADRPAAPLPVAIRFVATTESASTAALLRRCREAAAAARGPIDRMGAAGAAFFAAWRAGDRAALLRAVEAAYAGYEALGAAIGAPLVTADHAAIHSAAAQAGGAAKPSGAGGGDLAVVFLPADPGRPDEIAEAERRLVAALPAHLRVLPMKISAEGVHAVTQSTAQPTPSTIERLSS